MRSKQFQKGYFEGLQKGHDSGKLEAISRIYFKFKDGGNKKLLKYLQKEFNEYIPEFGKSEPTPYEKKFCYIETIEYRGLKIDLFSDDYGQQDYFYYNGQCFGCGAYNFESEKYLKDVVDYSLDFIYNLRDDDERFYDTYCMYGDHEHTRVNLNYRGQTVISFNVASYSSLEEIKQLCLNFLNQLFKEEEKA